MFRHISMMAVLLAAAAACDDGDGGGDVAQPTGQPETITTHGEDLTGPFFAELGTNQRTCATCHAAEASWSITPALVQARFDATGGADPLFRALDGATSPRADVSTPAARATAYQLLLDKALIRVGMPIPAGAEFTLSAVDDPYGFASAAELSLFRRPLPSTNLRFIADIMWDSREPDLEHQALDATMGHAAATMESPAETIAAIVAFESGTYSAQRTDDVAGDLASDGARGGAQALAAEPEGPTAAVDGETFGLFAAWADADTSTARGARRASIARGERLFNTRRFRIRGVGGLPDQQGTCSTCHSARNVGSRAAAGALDIGVSDEDRRTDDLPLYTLRRRSDGRTVQTSDPGLALVTGRWEDVGKFKVPSLRGLATRAPYFHNGMASDLSEVLDFYRRRFGVNFDRGDREDLVAFLGAL